VNLGAASQDNEHEDGSRNDPGGKANGLAIENGGDQQGDEGLQQLNLAHMGDPADGKSGIPGKEAEILAHEGDIGKADPTPGGDRPQLLREGPERHRNRNWQGTTRTQEMTSQPAKPLRTSLPETT
jgi:hypothetical protein